MILLARGYTPNLLEEVFMVKNAKNTAQWTHVKEDLNVEEIVGTF